jgi:hypothetical protein
MKTRDFVAYASLLALAGMAAQAQEAEAAFSDEQVKEALRESICLQDWDKAVAMSGLLIASDNITPEHRQTLVDWRHRFSNYAASQTKFDKIPNCDGIVTPVAVVASSRSVPVNQPSSVNQTFSTTVNSYSSTTANGNTEQLKAELHQAICEQDWNKAVDISSLLMAASDISATHRQTLVDWRYRFSNYAASQTKFSEIPNCKG